MIIAEGVLTWHADERRSDRYGSDERRSDRYGSVEMVREEGKFLPIDVGLVKGERGKLFAEVLETRQSGHLGDWARGLAPETPEVGEVIELGVGLLFVETNSGIDQVGVVPDDGRDFDWLDPKALYRLHSQTVRLQFEPVDESVI